MTINEATVRPNIAQNCCNTVDTIKTNLKSGVFATNSNLEDCATLVNAILRFLVSNEVEMPVPSEQGDSFSAYVDITRERSACVLKGLNQIAEALGIDL